MQNSSESRDRSWSFGTRMEYHGMLNMRVLTAMQKRDVEKVQQLLLMPNYDLNYSTQTKITPLILAAKLGLLSVCEKLVSLKVDLEHCDLDGRSALHHASCHGNTEIVNLLIEAGANVHLVNSEGDQPLHEAVSAGHLDTVEALVLGGSDVSRRNHVTGSYPLDLAVLHDRPEVVALLIRCGANVNNQSGARETALHFAVQVGSTDIIQQLLDAGADRNCTNNIGETPLTVAVQERKLGIVKYLVDAGCTISHSEFLSPMYVACRQNSQDIIYYLLSEGLNLSKDRWLIMRFSYMQLFESNPELMAAVFHRCENPISLKENCRVTIRQALRPALKENLKKLDLPKLIKSWIGLDDIYN